MTDATNEFVRQKMLDLNPSATLEGVADGWAAPVTVIETPNGFGEANWVDSVSISHIGIRLSGAPVACHWGPKRNLQSTHGPAVTLQPLGAPNHFSANGPIRFANIYLPCPLVATVAQSIGSQLTSAALRPDLIFLSDQHLGAMLVEYAQASLSRVSRLEMEARAVLMVARLLREHHGCSYRTPNKGGLASWQMKKVIAYLVDHLDRDVGLEELSRLLDLSPTHLCTAFRQSTGLPPHQWQMRRRIERAQEMLCDPSLSVTDIALSVGYANPGHFATVFKRATGHSPRDWRRERLS